MLLVFPILGWTLCTASCAHPAEMAGRGRGRRLGRAQGHAATGCVCACTLRASWSQLEPVGAAMQACLLRLLRLRNRSNNLSLSCRPAQTQAEGHARFSSSCSTRARRLRPPHTGTPTEHRRHSFLAYPACALLPPPHFTAPQRRCKCPLCCCVHAHARTHATHDRARRTVPPSCVPSPLQDDHPHGAPAREAPHQVRAAGGCRQAGGTCRSSRVAACVRSPPLARGPARHWQHLGHGPARHQQPLRGLHAVPGGVGAAATQRLVLPLRGALRGHTPLCSL